MAESNGKPLTPIARPLFRSVLRAWGRTGRKSGPLFDTIEKWGERLADRPLKTRLPNGCVAICDLHDLIQRHIYFAGLWEPVESYLFTRLVRPGMTVIDVGANIGQFTMLASTSAGPEGRVYSFEPVPSVYERLQEHVRMNSLANVTTVRAALWNADSAVNLGLDRSRQPASNSGNWSIGDAAAPNRVTADAIRLDSFAKAQGLKRLDVMKMDIEGAEPFVIAGAREVLSAWHPTILMEVNQPRLAALGNSAQSLWRDLRELGYRAWRIGLSPRRCGPAPDLEATGIANFILHHGELPDGITSRWDRRTPKRWACSGWRML